MLRALKRFITAVRFRLLSKRCMKIAFRISLLGSANEEEIQSDLNKAKDFLYQAALECDSRALEME